MEELVQGGLNTTLVRDYLDNFEYRIRDMGYKLELSIKSNEKRSFIVGLEREALRLVEDIRGQLSDVDLLCRVVGQEEVAYKERRLQFVDSNITERLRYIFPKKGLVAETECDFKRHQTKLKLHLVDRRGNKRPPFVTEGKGAQQLVSYTAAESCLLLLGKDKIYLDEPFSNASEITQLKIQDCLRKSLEDGFQIIMIAHSSLLYNDLPRRELQLESEDGEFISNISIIDYGENGKYISNLE